MRSWKVAKFQIKNQNSRKEFICDYDFTGQKLKYSLVSNVNYLVYPSSSGNENSEAVCLLEGLEEKAAYHYQSAFWKWMPHIFYRYYTSQENTAQKDKLKNDNIVVLVFNPQVHNSAKQS